MLISSRNFFLNRFFILSAAVENTTPRTSFFMTKRWGEVKLGDLAAGSLTIKISRTE